MIFWTLLFPVILAILFDMALSNISNIDDFEKINLAIVLKSESEENTAFLEAADDTDLFNITDTSEAKANDMLNNNQVDGVILFDESPQILVSQSGINQTIIKSFVDQYLQITSTLTTIISDNPQALNSGLIDSISDQQEYLSEVAATLLTSW
jgi:ABC-2 type transport system permease protein